MTVHVPGLLGPWPRALAGDIVRGLDLPGLVGLLTRSRRVGGRLRPRADAGVASFERLAFSAFGYPPGTDDVPAASLMRARDAGVDPGRSPPASLCADPVHLRPDLDAARLFDASCFSLSGEEAAALAGALDRHFAPEGIRLEAPHPSRWYVRLDEHPDAVFRPPGIAAGRGAGGSLPEGNEGSLWRRRMNEAQMVLHDHPCNESREARGELPVNSVWFWGAGEIAGAPRTRFDEVRSDSALVRALAERGGARVRGLEEEAENGGTLPRASLVAPGDALYRAVAGRDVEEWRRLLVRLEEDWFRALHGEVRTGAVRKVVIDAGLRPGEAVHEAVPRSRWRRPARRSSAEGLAGFILDEDAGGG